MNSCDNCRYSQPRISSDGDPILDCHRYPPVIHIAPDTGEPFMFIPQVDGTDWCGEWATAVSQP